MVQDRALIYQIYKRMQQDNTVFRLSNQNNDQKWKHMFDTNKQTSQTIRTIMQDYAPNDVNYEKDYIIPSLPNVSHYLRRNFSHEQKLKHSSHNNPAPARNLLDPSMRHNHRRFPHSCRDTGILLHLGWTQPSFYAVECPRRPSHGVVVQVGETQGSTRTVSDVEPVIPMLTSRLKLSLRSRLTH